MTNGTDTQNPNPRGDESAEPTMTPGTPGQGNEPVPDQMQDQEKAGRAREADQTDKPAK